MLKRAIGLFVAALALAGVGLQAQEAAPAADEGEWIHVRVDEADGAQVAVNLPLSLVDVALEIGETEGLDPEELRFGPDDAVSMDQLRRIWRELRDAGDAELVSVRDGDEHVRIWREGDRVHVRAGEDGREKVRAVLPPAVVDALLGGDGDRLELSAAARELARAGDREIVRVDDGGTRVRVWVDRTAAPGGDR